MKQAGLRKVRPGEPVLASEWNRLVDIIKVNSLTAGEDAGLVMRQGMGGTGIALAQQPQACTLAITTSVITARVGTTPGTGTVNYLNYDEANNNLITDADFDIDVLNFSSTSGGIPDNTYVWITEDAIGFWWVVAVDCAN